jgi:transcriptional regulator with XRE-family HTH domain
MTPFAQRLVLGRIDLDISQGELAQRAGISQSFLSRIERGRVHDVSIATLHALAAALGVRPEYLAGWSDDPLGEDRPASVAEGRVVYQVDTPTQYRLVQDLLDVFGELSPESQRLLLQLAEQLRRANGVRIIGDVAGGGKADAGR